MDGVAAWRMWSVELLLVRMSEPSCRRSWTIADDRVPVGRRALAHADVTTEVAVPHFYGGHRLPLTHSVTTSAQGRLSLWRRARWWYRGAGVSKILPGKTNPACDPGCEFVLSGGLQPQFPQHLISG